MPKARNTTLAHDELVAALDYDAETGIFTWRPSNTPNAYAGKKAGADSHHGYIKIFVKGYFYYAHTLAWMWVFGSWPPNNQQLDHIDGNGHNNSIRNLRLLSSQENAAVAATRLRVNNTSGHPGVSFEPGKRKWQAKIQVRRQQRHLGWFLTLNEALEARQLAFGELYGRLIEEDQKCQG